MGAPTPLLQSARSIARHRIPQFLTLVLIAALGGTLLLSTAHAQSSQVSLLTLATDQTPLNLSNHFGVPAIAVVNQNGDYAFIGRGGSALFIRLHGAAAATRLLQFGDAVPGFAGSSAVGFNLGGLNSSAHLAFAVDFTVSPPDGQPHSAILIYNGSSYSTVTSSDTVAAGPLGLPFGPSVGFPTAGGSFDDNDDVLLTTTFQPFQGTVTALSQTTYYIAPAGGTPVRVVGLGDTMPGETPSVFTSFNGVSQLNALGQFLFEGTCSGCQSGVGNGTGANTYNGLFLGSLSGGTTGVVTFVVVTNQFKPGGGTFAPAGNLNQGELNDNGQVAFVNPVSPDSVWLYSAGTITNTYPSPATATTITLSGLSNLGEAVGIIATTGSPASLVRIHSNGTIDTVTTIGPSAPFTTVSDAATDNNDRIIFNGSTATAFGIYQQTSTNSPQPIALAGQSATPLSGGGTLDFSGTLLPKALDNGSTFFGSEISNGTANWAEFLGTPGNLNVLMSTADTLPSGAKVRLSNPSSGDNFLAFSANLTGGQTAIFVESFLGGIDRLVSEGDVIAGFGGATLVEMATLSGAKPFYVNDAGQIAFPAALTGNMQAILLSESAVGPLV